MELSTALLTSLAIPLTTSETFLSNPADFIGQTLLYKVSNGTTRLWRAIEISPNTSGPFAFNIGWQLLYGIRFATSYPANQTTPYENPYGIGEWFVDTTTNIVYLAKGTDSSSWIPLVGSGGSSSA